jgi:pimeloyl-ACP methyl ester carboxylesterase
MQSAFISYRHSVIHYYYTTGGNKILFCFHGYSEEGSSFSFLEKNICKGFSFFAIDLPFHGKTDWKDGLIFTKTDLQNIIEEILTVHTLKQQAADLKLTLIGYSLGGRIALSLYQAMPDQIEKLVLIAPDGLKVNFWYWLATQTYAGNNFFRFVLKYPGWFLWFLKRVNKLGLVNTSIYKFVHHYIGDKEVRRLLYVRWTTLRKHKPNLKLIRSLVVKNNTPVRLLYGKYDRIILSSTGEKFKRGMEEQCTLTVIQSGHQLLQEKYATEVIQALIH